MSDIHNAELVNTEYGFVSYTDLFEFKRSTIFNSSHSCITLNLKNNYNYSIEEINMKHCSDIGIGLVGEGKIHVDNVHIENAKTGIYVNGEKGKLQLTSSIIEHCVSAVHLEYGYSSSDAGDFKLEHCRIAHCANGINYGVRFVGRPAQIAINNNMFTNISKNTLSINFISYEYRNDKHSTGYIDIGLNTFRNVCDIYLKTWNNATLNFHDNKVENSSCLDSDNCLLHAFAKGNKQIQNRVFSVSTNVFTNINSKCVVKLQSSGDDAGFDGLFYYNQFLFTRATLGTTLLDSMYFNISHNIFDNPLSLYDVYVQRKGMCFFVSSTCCYKGLGWSSR